MIEPTQRDREMASQFPDGLIEGDFVDQLALWLAVTREEGRQEERERLTHPHQWEPSREYGGQRGPRVCKACGGIEGGRATTMQTPCPGDILAGTETGTHGGGSQQEMRPWVAHEYEPRLAFAASKCKWCGHILGTQDHACTRSQF